VSCGAHYRVGIRADQRQIALFPTDGHGPEFLGQPVHVVLAPSIRDDLRNYVRSYDEIYLAELKKILHDQLRQKGKLNTASGRDELENNYVLSR
jgi:hypothetical protein